MRLLRRVLYWEAAVWTVTGLSLAIIPRPVLVTLFNQRPYPDYGLVRVAGMHAIGLAMLEVLVGHKAEEIWWFSWAFVIATAGISTVVVLNAAFGLAPGSSSAFWWIFAAIAVAFTAALLWGMVEAGNERPIM